MHFILRMLYSASTKILLVVLSSVGRIAPDWWFVWVCTICMLVISIRQTDGKTKRKYWSCTVQAFYFFYARPYMPNHILHYFLSIGYMLNHVYEQSIQVCCLPHSCYGHINITSVTKSIINLLTIEYFTEPPMVGHDRSRAMHLVFICQKSAC